MPRRARIDAPGAVHHIIVRGIERKHIFRDEADRRDFLDRLARILGESATPCYAWTLMPNHVHLLLRSGSVPIPAVMGRLLTGYAVTFNRRYRRHGPLFQNRYKSVLCQEDLYLLELVRYIHLNPLRAGLLNDLEALDTYPYCGHSALMGYQKNSWQDTNYLLSYFGSNRALSRRRYRAHVKKGIGQGRRSELAGGAMIRSMGGWGEVKTLRRHEVRMKGDERILGESSFVEKVLRVAEEKLDRQYRLRSEGFDLERLAVRVGEVLGVSPETVWSSGKYPEVVEARSLFCYWAVRELGKKVTELAKRLRLSQPGVSISVRRGEKIVKGRGLRLLER